MRVLFVTSEVAPIRKFGGLGDFSASLPSALSELGIEVDIIMPMYDDAKIGDLKFYQTSELSTAFNNKTYTSTFFKTKLPKSQNVDIILIKVQFPFSGDFLNDVEFFSLFDRTVVDYIKSQYNTYEIIHCNDWHTGLITHMLEDELETNRPKTLLTIHNLGYQGINSSDLPKKLGFVPGKHPLIDWDTADGDINMLFQAMTSSDYINTVSPAYAQELLTPQFGGGFCEIINERKDRFSGILNGIDYATIPRNYDIKNWQIEKPKHKTYLQNKLNIKQTQNPIFAFISRLDPNQKGLEILFEIVSDIILNGGQFVLLGTGDKTWEDKFKNLLAVTSFKDNLSINLTFSEELALSIYSGSDFFLIPSKYEPCGLTQMISMWYGTLPVARKVGGLKDTVKDDFTGITFDNYSSQDLKAAIIKAFALFKDKNKYKALVENAIMQDFSWKNSAKEYKMLYDKMRYGNIYI